MENLITPSATEEDKKEKQLTAILYLLQSKLEEYSNEVEKSYALLKIGEKADLTQEIESSINDPFGAMSKMTSNIDNNIKSIIDVFVKAFFKGKNDLILKAYKSHTSLNDLHYSIVLKEDSFENRNSIFEFYDKFDLQEVSYKCPVYFQFTPIELVDRIKVKEEIVF